MDTQHGNIGNIATVAIAITYLIFILFCKFLFFPTILLQMSILSTSRSHRVGLDAVVIPRVRVGKWQRRMLIWPRGTVSKWRRLGLNSGLAPEPKTHPRAVYETTPLIIFKSLANRSTFLLFQKSPVALTDGAVLAPPAAGTHRLPLGSVNGPI